MKTPAFILTGVAALFLTTGTAHAVDVVDGPRGERDNRKWVWRCSFPHTPSEEQVEESEQCCKRWPNVPHCNGDWLKAMSLPRCAKLPFLANIKCAERVLEEKRKR